MKKPIVTSPKAAVATQPKPAAVAQPRAAAPTQPKDAAPQTTPDPSLTDLNLAPHRVMLDRLGIEAPDVTTASAASISDLLQTLRATYRQLLDVSDDDIKAMSDADRTAWLRFGDELFQDIRILEINELAQLNAEFTGKLPELQNATAQLSKSFTTLNNVVQAVKAAAQVLKIVTDIVSLLK
jgi:hypothetical protein